MMQETRWFYSLISLRYSGNIMLIQNSKILQMNKCSMNITWLHNFSLKARTNCAASFSTKSRFPPNSYHAFYFSHFPLVVNPTILSLGVF